jgi:hypothetical protein
MGERLILARTLSSFVAEVPLTEHCMNLCTDRGGHQQLTVKAALLIDGHADHNHAIHLPISISHRSPHKLLWRTDWQSDGINVATCCYTASFKNPLDAE